MLLVAPGVEGRKRKDGRREKQIKRWCVESPGFRLHSKCSSVELPLRVGLIHAGYTHGYSPCLQSAYEPHAHNGSSVLECFEHGNVIKIHNSLISTQDYHMCDVMRRTRGR